MPQHKTTYRELYLRMFNLLKFKHEYWSVIDACPTIVKEVTKFENYNKIPLQRLLERQNELYEKYVETEPIEMPDKSISSQYVFVEPSQLHIAGQPQKHHIHTGIDGRVPKFISPEAEDEFNRKWIELLNETCDITT